MIDSKAYKVMIVLALVLGVVGVTLGYAAFSNTLTISSSAEVTPDSGNFNVDFSSTDVSVATNPVVATLVPNNVTGFTATNGTIDNTTDPTITGLKATFTEPGQKATYTFYSYNAGQYIAYLNSITFSGNKTCTAITPQSGTAATDALVQSACAGITLKVTVGATGPVTETQATISQHPLQIGSSEQVTVEIEYATNSAIADGDFEVTFPNIVLNYGSAD